jgi:hypothetical protein
LKNVGGIGRSEVEFHGDGIDEATVTLDQRFPRSCIPAEAQRDKFGIPERLVLIVAHLPQFPGLPERVETKRQGQERKADGPQNLPQTGGRRGKLSVFVDTVETKNTGKDQQERSSNLKPKLMK